MSGPIVWLASYPSSGNTWMRVLLSNLLHAGDRPADINALSINSNAGSRGVFDAYAGVRASDLTSDEVDVLRPAVYEAMARDLADPSFIKIHDAYSYTSSGEPLVSSAATRGAIYIIRNPLDVAVAYAHHQHVTFEANIRRMADDDHCLNLNSNGLSTQLTQRLWSWSRHVESWVDAADLPVCVVRYEDMKQDSVRAFGAAADFVGLAYTRAQLERAIAFSDFRELRRQEDASGFGEGSLRAHRFFRRGQTGAWRDELTPEQAARVIAANGAVMRRFGYLDADGNVP